MAIDLQLEPRIASRLSDQATIAERSQLTEIIVEFCHRVCNGNSKF
jgi:hypothetical protein